MSTPTPPPATPPSTLPGVTTPTTPILTGTTTPSTGVGALFGLFALIPILFLIAFHVGAGYLSYQKYGSIGWAILDFLFAYFYYPYYAFFLATPPAPTGFIGGLKKLMGGRRK